MFSIVYGRQSPEFNNQDLKNFFECDKRFLYALLPENNALADMVPALNLLPEWLAPWKKRWREVKREQK